MTNKAKRNLSVSLLIISIIALAVVILFEDYINPTTDTKVSWYFIIVVCGIFYFSVSYRNYAKAVRNDKNTGIRGSFTR